MVDSACCSILRMSFTVFFSSFFWLGIGGCDLSCVLVPRVQEEKKALVAAYKEQCATEKAAKASKLVEEAGARTTPMSKRDTLAAQEKRREQEARITERRRIANASGSSVSRVTDGTFSSGFGSSDLLGHLLPGEQAQGKRRKKIESAIMGRRGSVENQETAASKRRRAEAIQRREELQKQHSKEQQKQHGSDGRYMGGSAAITRVIGTTLEQRRSTPAWRASQ